MKQIRRITDAESPTNIALGQILASGLALVTAPIVARAIGPEGRGETAAVLAAFYIWPLVAALGMPLEVRRVAATGNGAEALRRARRVMLFMPVPSIAVALTLDATIFSTLDRAGRITACIGLALAPLMVSWMCDQSLLIGRRRYRQVAAIQICPPFVYLLIVLAGWLTGHISVPYVLAASIAGNAATAALGMSLTRVSVRGPCAKFGSFMSKSVRYSGSSMADAFANRIDQLLALPVIGTVQAGYYAVAATVGVLGMPLGHALAADSFNEVAKMSHDSRSRRAAIETNLRAALGLSLVFTLLLIPACPVLVPIVFGTAFSGAVLPAVILSVGGMAIISAYVAALMLAASDRGVAMSVAQLARLVLLVGLFVPLGLWFGAVGAAIAVTAVSWLLLGILTILLTGSLKAWLVLPADCLRGVRQIVGRAAT